MSTTEEELPESMAQNLVRAAIEGAEIVAAEMDSSAHEVISKINTFLEPPNSKNSNVDNWSDLVLPIGCLWAKVVIEHFGWAWVSLIQHDHDDFQAVAIVNQDRSLAIFPFHYIFGCLENGVDPTILLAFNMLDTGGIPPQPANGYANMMDGVRHIIPSSNERQM